MSESESPAPSSVAHESAASKEARPTCRCGYDRTHYMVSPEAKHTFWGWVLISLGITSKPIEMTFRCRRCGQVIEVSTRPEDLHINR